MAEPVAVAPGMCHVTTHRQSLPGPRSSTREPPLSQEALVRWCASVTSGRCSSPVCMRYRWAKAVARAIPPMVTASPLAYLHFMRRDYTGPVVRQVGEVAAHEEQVGQRGGGH